MKPKQRSQVSQLNLFQSHFDQLLNLNHPLCLLARKIDWHRFDLAFADCYSPEMGAPGKDIRLLVGLHYLKHTFNESDESLLDRWVENPYWQYFCGFSTMQHQVPLHATSLVKWRQRVGAEKLLALLTETVAIAVKDKQISKKELAQVNVDTTVQEKNITHPTDSKLYLKAINKLTTAAKNRGIKLRQTYTRVAKAAACMVGRYAHAKQFRRMRNRLRKMKTWLGRVIRDVRRKVPQPDAALQELLILCERLFAQQPFDKDKLYSLHEPEVKCISKGKAEKRYEFGQKISVTSTNRHNWIVGITLCRGNPYDGHTLKQAIATTEQITQVGVTDCFVDKGYRGHNYDGQAVVHISGSSPRKLTRVQKNRRKRRSAIEPKIGHLKRDSRMGRCFLKGLSGDEINAVLAAAGSNLQKLLRAIAPALILWLWSEFRTRIIAFQRILRPVMTPI
ncbi:IS5 family transposase [Rubinisphaera sp.]|uniref:IS5 family transposase n=1 Tax=Rubinisphaera sp. TaxID=2024857 RepID=UPI000C0D49E9|nr:IS5 family transposase [Rubinisphaera sp.]MBV09669.1 IS5/IS1182 family transposase [Rubinisphaera sp.]